jgi:hypothetical protein
MISLSALTILVSAALLLASATPVILLVLVYRDWKDGKLW